MYLNPAHQSVKSCWTVLNALFTRIAIVMSNGERDRYYICEDYTIANEWLFPLCRYCRNYDISIKEEKEIFYHWILLGLLWCKPGWLIQSNIESGDGSDQKTSS